MTGAAAEGFATAEATARQIWTAIEPAVNGAIVPVAAVYIAEQAAQPSAS